MATFVFMSFYMSSLISWEQEFEVSPHNSFQFLQTHPIPSNWKYEDARKLFFETPQTDTPELAWKDPDEEGLVQFLCREKPLK